MQHLFQPIFREVSFENKAVWKAGSAQMFGYQTLRRSSAARRVLSVNQKVDIGVSFERVLSK